MQLTLLVPPLSVIQIEDLKSLDVTIKPLFLGVTEEEVSVVLPTENVPEGVLNREEGWRGLKIEGVLDFSLVGILAKIASLLAEVSISIFAISTFNTDYILVKEEQLVLALETLRQAGYQIAK